MTPDVDGLLRTSFLTLVGEVAPALGGYLAGSAGAIGALLFMAAAEYERGADIRVAENAEMRALLAEGASLVAYADLAGRLRAGASESDPSLRISDLNAANDRLARLLIELQAAVEEMPQAGAFEMKIWVYLTKAADRRKLPHPAELAG